MDFNLKQWRDQQQQQESEEAQQQPSAKIPRQLFLETPQHQHQHQHQHQQQEGAAAAAALPLFVSSDSEPQTNGNKLTTHFSSAYSSTTTTTPSPFPTTSPRFPRVGGGGYCFSISQWQELELQALIFKHMMAGAAVPQELLQLVKKSLLTTSASPFHYLHHYPTHFQPAATLVQAGYWGKGAMDPEPGRCRRTDGKKWRCSRDVVAGHKYCERHMHRGRNRSRKPVEFPASAGTGGGASASLSKSAAVPAFAGGSAGGAQFSLSGSGASLDAFQLNRGSSELSSDKKARFEPQHEPYSGDGKSGNKVLMHFFDDWPRSLQETDNAGTNGNSSSMCLAMSNTSNPTSDFLRLSTGNGIELGQRDGNGNGNEERQQRGHQLNWSTGWGANPVASMGMGGPLAEALRSSTHSSPNSVLHQLPPSSASDTSYVTA